MKIIRRDEVNSMTMLTHPCSRKSHKKWIDWPYMTEIHENLQKQRRGLNRIVHALGYSLQGLKAGMFEPAFKQEALLAFFLLPLSFFVGNNWVEISLLAGSVVFVLIVELLNTGLESAIDRVGPQWHDLSKRCKDLGSAAVLLSILLCMGIWLAALYVRFTLHTL
jgi:diacylglycerol kinase (ATP)